MNLHNKVHLSKVYNSVVFSMFTELHKHHQNLILVQFLSLPKEPVATESLLIPHHLQPQQPLIYFLFQQIYVLWRFHINDVIQYVYFCDWLNLLDIFYNHPHCSMYYNFILFCLQDFLVFQLVSREFIIAHWRIIEIFLSWLLKNLVR